MRTSLALTVALGVGLVLTGCGSHAAAPDALGPAPSTTTSDVAARSQVSGPDDVLVGTGILMQKSPEAPVEICVGGVLESWPPQCGGPRIVGDVDWDGLGVERVGDVTFTREAVWGVGRLDLAKDTFTLTEPLSATPPSTWRTPTPTPMTFPQLCEDPYAGGGRKGAGSPEDQHRVQDAMTSLAGYVTSWVSDGRALYNILVTGDPTAAHARLRALWKGGLCVEQRDLPTAQAITSAQKAVGDLATAKKIHLQSTGSNPTGGGLDVMLTVLDESSMDAVLDAVRPWLDPSQVTFSSVFTPISK